MVGREKEPDRGAHAKARSQKSVGMLAGPAKLQQPETRANGHETGHLNSLVDPVFNNEYNGGVRLASGRVANPALATEAVP